MRRQLLSDAPNFFLLFPVFFQLGYALLVVGQFKVYKWHFFGFPRPPDLCVPFNKIISEVQGWKAVGQRKLTVTISLLQVKEKKYETVENYNIFAGKGEKYETVVN